eukprot:gene5236-382_t
MAASKSSDEEVNNDQDLAFVANMGKLIEHNALGISLAIGYRVGLIEVLANLDEPKTSIEIADKAGLNERTVILVVKLLSKVTSATSVTTASDPSVCSICHALKQLLYMDYSFI